MTESIRGEESDAERQALIAEQLAQGYIELELVTPQMMVENPPPTIRVTEEQAQNLLRLADDTSPGSPKP